jgi:hypothetical protein
VQDCIPTMITFCLQLKKLVLRTYANEYLVPTKGIQI